MSAGLLGWAIEALIASAALMGAALALRGPVRRAFGPHAAYALWLLPVLRLALPPLPQGWRESIATPLSRASETVTVLVIDPVSAPVAGTAATAPVVHHPSLGPVMVLLWAAGAAAFLLWHMIDHARFRRRILKAPMTSGELAGGVRVVESDAASGPLAFGVLRRYVAFPRDFAARYDADEQDLALAHELGHHQRGDLIANWIALAVLALHWFNPIAWRAFRAFRADQEMANDAWVLAHRDPALRHAYGRAIVKSAHGGTIGATCHLHTINDLKGRLKMLAVTPKSHRRMQAGLATIAFVTLAGLGLTASGTQAAETLKNKVQTTTGLDLARFDVTPPAPPPAPAALASAFAPVPPVPQAAPAPDAPPAPEVAPAPPAPPAPEAFDGTINRSATITTDANGQKRRVVRVIMRDHDGKVVTDNVEGADAVMADMPEISSASCPDASNKQVVINEDHGGKRRMIICTNRIEKLAADSEKLAANSVNTAEIERNAYRSALTGLQSARARVENDPKVTGDARSEALAAIDQSIAEIQADIAKAD
jgi:beta-lactamase regulating signal transducer with metallopeptidase domain